MLENIQPTLLGYVVLAVFLYLLYRLLFKTLSSKAYHFIKQSHRVSLHVTYRLLGLLPFSVKKFTGIAGYELIEYEHETDNGTYDKAKIELQTTSGDIIEATQIVTNNDVDETKAGAKSLDKFFASTRDDDLLVDKGRFASLLFSVLASLFLSACLVGIFALGHKNLLNLKSSATTVTDFMSDASSFQSSKLKDFPTDIPLPKNADIDTSQYDGQSKTWQLYLRTPFDEDGKKLTLMLKQAFQQQGWQTTTIEDMPYQSPTHNMASGGAFLFDFRKLSEQRYGSVTVMKDDPWLIIIEVSQK